MVSPLVLLKTPSALDLAVAEVMPGGAKRYIYPDPEAATKEAADREAMPHTGATWRLQPSTRKTFGQGA